MLGEKRFFLSWSMADRKEVSMADSIPNEREAALWRAAERAMALWEMYYGANPTPEPSDVSGRRDGWPTESN